MNTFNTYSIFNLVVHSVCFWHGGPGALPSHHIDFSKDLHVTSTIILLGFAHSFKALPLGISGQILYTIPSVVLLSCRPKYSTINDHMTPVLDLIGGIGGITTICMWKLYLLSLMFCVTVQQKLHWCELSLYITHITYANTLKSQFLLVTQWAWKGSFSQPDQVLKPKRAFLDIWKQFSHVFMCWTGTENPRIWYN